LSQTETQRTNRPVAANEWKNKGSILVSQGEIDKNIINPESSVVETVGDGVGCLLFPGTEI